jgi:hypothetical protein
MSVKNGRKETVTISLLITKKQHQWFQEHTEYNVSALVRQKLEDFIREQIIREQMQRKE